MVALRKTPKAERAPRSGQDRPRVVLRSLLLSIVSIVALALAGAGLSAISYVDQRANSEIVANAPAMLRMAAELAASQHIQDEPALRRLAAELERIPTIRACEIEYRVHPPEGSSESPKVLRYATSAADGRECLRLQAPVNDNQGRPSGRVALSFASPKSSIWQTGMWLQMALVVAAAAAACAWVHRRTRIAMRPLEQVHDNLISYHEGVEPALELLSVQDTRGVVAESWNSFVQAVTELRREIERSRCKEAMYDAGGGVSRTPSMVLDRLPIGVLRLDDRNAVTFVTPAAVALLNLSPAGGAPRLLSERLRDPSLADKLLGLRDISGPGPRELRLTLADGDTVVRVTPLALDTRGDELTLMLQDISQLVQAERSRDDFLAHITHELRTPLTNIRAYTETLTQDFMDDEQMRRECYNVITSETGRLAKLIEDVLSVSQIEAGGARLARTSVRVEELLRQTVQEMQAHADAKKIELTLKVPSKVPLVSGDRHRLHQVWTNLVGNAVKYTPNGGRVAVEVEAGEQRLMVRITDSGIGIPAEFQEKVFEKFFRVHDAAVDATEGTGLGLPIAREILRMHGGSIRVESAAGKGSTFTVELPTAKSSELAGMGK